MTKRAYKIIAVVGALLTLAALILIPGVSHERFDPVWPTLIATFACVTILASMRSIRR